MRCLLIFLIIGVTGCTGDWRARAINDAEVLVRQQVNDPKLKFAHVQFTGDSSSGQTCGYYERPVPGGGVSDTRFIAFIDGGNGQNPFIGDPSAPYPANKDDFALNWRTQCLELGYRE
jgi:hypothetical protein